MTTNPETMLVPQPGIYAMVSTLDGETRRLKIGTSTEPYAAGESPSAVYFLIEQQDDPHRSMIFTADAAVVDEALAGIRSAVRRGWFGPMAKTLGRELVGVPLHDAEMVADIKHQAAALIDQLDKLRDETEHAVVRRWASEAITCLETGSMFGVKAAVAEALGGSLLNQ